MLMNKQMLDSVAIVGAFESPRRKANDVHPFQIFHEVIAGALADAGLTFADVDGLCVTGGDAGEGGSTEDVTELAEYLGLTPRYVDSTDVGGCSAMVQVAHAAAAIACGLADTVVVAYAACPRWFPLGPTNPMSWPVGPGAMEMPYGITNISAYGLFAARHMHQFGTTPEQLASVPVAIRANAAQNPMALARDPISVADVLASPLVSTPFHKLDCCVVTDSGGAVVLTRRDRARDTKKAPIRLLGYGEAVTRVHVNQVHDFTVSPGVKSGKQAFEVAGLRPSDVDVAQFYDAFSITPLIGLEDLGFCKKGEGGPFVAGGSISAGGSIPINTDGGGLSSNHPGKRGVFVLIEALRQLWGESPGVQVSDCNVSLAHGIGGFFSAASTMLLARL
jgi:acetyl-CoA acetyltransferase